MTPEGKIKKKVSTFLQSKPNLYYWMPVPSGYGATTLDYVGCYLGKYFAVETKAPGKKPTDRQNVAIAMMRRAGAAVFVIDSGDISQLEAWCTEQERS